MSFLQHLSDTWWSQTLTLNCSALDFRPNVRQDFCCVWMYSLVSGSLQTPLSPAAYCEPHKPTHSCKPAKSATFGTSTVRLELVGAFAFPLALLSLDIAWVALWAAQLAAHFNEKWIPPSLLPFQCTLDAPILNLFFFFSGLVSVWVILAFLNSDLTRNLVNQKFEQTAPPPCQKKKRLQRSSREI